MVFLLLFASCFSNHKFLVVKPDEEVYDDVGVFFMVVSVGFFVFQC